MRKDKSENSVSTVLSVLFAIIFAGIAAFYIYIENLPPISQLASFQPNLVSQFVSSDEVVIKTFTSYKFQKIDIKEIPDNLKKAIIATEDKNFYQHGGYDLVALVRSSLSNLKAGHVVQGASTITQQLARILFLSTEKTYDRKIKEFIISNRLEKTLTKDEILGMYLNNVYLGEGAYGVSAASEIYFNKKVSDLTLPEAALIAGLPQAPSVYTPYKNMDLALKRRSKVLDRMVKMGYITQEEADKANATKININKYHRPYSLNKAPYFVDYAVKELAKIGLSEDEIVNGGYKVYTTLNFKYQLAANKSLESNLARSGFVSPDDQAALVSYDAATGQILAYIGGKNYRESQYDRASSAVRQPGSAFKMFVYAAALERGYSPEDIVDDTQVKKMGDWAPKNYSNKYRGKIPLSTALAISSNSVAVKLISEIGVRAVADMAQRLGINTPISNDYTIALGSSGVRLSEITTAYGTIANGGMRVKPYAVERVETSSGRVIYQASNNYEQVLDTRTVSGMVQMLRQVIKSGTGKVANISNFVAGKTGTTDDYKDAWFVGFTPEVVTGVWVGNDRNKSHRGLTGGTVPARIWADYMRVVEKSKPSGEFSYPQLDIVDPTAGNTTTTPVQEELTDEDLEIPMSGDLPQKSSAPQNNVSPPVPTPMSAPVPPPVHPTATSQYAQKKSPPPTPEPDLQYQ